MSVMEVLFMDDCGADSVLVAVMEGSEDASDFCCC